MYIYFYTYIYNIYISTFVHLVLQNQNLMTHLKMTIYAS